MCGPSLGPVRARVGRPDIAAAVARGRSCRNRRLRRINTGQQRVQRSGPTGPTPRCKATQWPTCIASHTRPSSRVSSPRWRPYAPSNLALVTESQAACRPPRRSGTSERVITARSASAPWRAMPAQDSAQGDQAMKRSVRGSHRTSAANTARSPHSRHGLGLVRRSTATSCRNTSSSTSLAEDGRHVSTAASLRKRVVGPLERLSASLPCRDGDDVDQSNVSRCPQPYQHAGVDG